MEDDVEALNAHLREMSPEGIIARIKGVIYRNLSTINICDQHHHELSMSEKLMGDTTQQIFGALLDSLKWICMKHQVDVNAPYGDDTLIHQVADLRFGVPLEEDEEEPNEPMSEETEEPGFEWDDITSKDE